MTFSPGRVAGMECIRVDVIRGVHALIGWGYEGTCSWAVLGHTGALNWHMSGTSGPCRLPKVETLRRASRHNLIVLYNIAAS